MLGCIQPMSSPMMKRMLGFCCCCAAAGALAAITATNDTSRPRQNFLVRLMASFLIFGCPNWAGSRRPRRRFGAMMSNILRYGWKPKEAMQAL